MSQTDLDLSIIIPHLNDPEGLTTCLKSLEKQSATDISFEVIVCDNNSETPLPDFTEFIFPVHSIVEMKRGAGPARNAGIKLARGQFLAFTDCDCRLHMDFIRNGMAQMLSYGENSVMAGEIIIESSEEFPNWIEAYEIVFSMDQKLYASRGDAATGNLWTSKMLFEKVGEFKDGVAEDTDWSQRAYALGAIFHFGATSIAFHPARSTLEELRAKWRRQSAMTYNVWREKKRFLLLWPLYCFATAASCIPHSLIAIKDKRLVRTADKLGAILALTWCRLFRAKTMLGFYIGNHRYIDPVKFWS